MQTYPKEFEDLIINILKIIREKEVIHFTDIYESLLHNNHVSAITFDIAIEKLVKLTIIKDDDGNMSILK